MREEDQVTLFGAKMLGFFGVKIEMYLSSFHACRLAFKIIIVYMLHIVSFVAYFMDFIYVKKYSRYVWEYSANIF